MSHGIRDQKDNETAVEHRQIAHDTQDGLLLRADDMSRPYQLGGATKLRADSRRGNQRNRFAAPY